MLPLAVTQLFARGHRGKHFTINLSDLNLHSKCIQAKSNISFQFALRIEMPRLNKQNKLQALSLLAS